MLLFILGRQPEIGLAELRAVSNNQAELIAPGIAMIDRSLSWDSIDDSQKKTARRQFARLGSTVKIAEVFGEIPDLSRTSLAKILREKFSSVEGKITIGISLYGEKFLVRDIAKVSSEVKNILQTKNSVRLIPNTEKALSSAAVFHNKLDSNNIKKSELIFVPSNGKVFIARTIFVQNINSYTLRDRGRPKRDARVGMLPPKLAQTMINLAGGGKFFNDFPAANLSDIPKAYSETSHLSNKVYMPDFLLDPFCGTGVVLQEALLMGIKYPYGTDIEPRMVEYTMENLRWAVQKFNIKNYNMKIYPADATNENWLDYRRSKVKPESDAMELKSCADLVITETYLGRPYATAPDETSLRKNIANCDIILTKFLKNLRSQITEKTGVCVAIPCWFVRNRVFHLKLVRNLAEIGFEQIFYSHDKKPLIYHRENQIVGRELLVLRKKI